MTSFIKEQGPANRSIDKDDPESGSDEGIMAARVHRESGRPCVFRAYCRPRIGLAFGRSLARTGNGSRGLLGGLGFGFLGLGLPEVGIMLDPFVAHVALPGIDCEQFRMGALHGLAV